MRHFTRLSMDQVTFDVYMYGLGNLGLNSLSIERVAGNTAFILFFFFYEKLSLIQASPANPPLHGLTRKVSLNPNMFFSKLFACISESC